MTKKVLTIGGALQDIFIEFKDPEMLHLHGQDHDQSFIAFEEGKKIAIDALHTFVGGGAANTATSFKRLGFDAEAFFKIGTDAPGDFIINHLKSQGVNVDHAVRSPEQQTGSSYILPCPSGNKSSLVYRGANITLTQKEIPYHRIVDCDQLYITSLSLNVGSILPSIVQYAKNHGKSVAINPGSNQVRYGAADVIASLPFIDILILNSYESKLLMDSMTQRNELSTPQALAREHSPHTLPALLRSHLTPHSSHFNVRDYCNKILALGPKIVIITNGAEGVYAAHHNTLYFYPSPSVTVISSVGAGDAFGSAFVASMLRGNSLEQSLIAGTYNSSSVIQHIGTQTGLLNTQEMTQHLKNADFDGLQTFEL